MLKKEKQNNTTMNKHYKHALIEAAADEIKKQGYGVGYEDLQDLVGELEDDLSEDFQADVETVVECYLEDQKTEADLEEQDGVRDLWEEIDNLKVGVNVIPGVGVAVASDEKDLEALKEHLKGALGAAEILAGLLGLFRA